MKNLIKFVMAGLLLCCFVSLLASGCSEEEDCSMNARALLNCNLYTLDEETGSVRRDTLDSLTVTALGTDSIIINRERDVKTLALPLRYTADSTVLVFRYEAGRYDTLIIRHTNTPYFLSMDCGYQMKQTVSSISYSRHLLDSIHISDPEAGIYETENIQLFY